MSSEQPREDQKTNTSAPPTAGTAAQPVVDATLVIRHPTGLHLRPAAQFVQTAARFGSTVRVKNLSRPEAPEIDAKSMFGMLQCGVAQGHAIRVRAEGRDAVAAVAALRALVERDFEDA